MELSTRVLDRGDVRPLLDRIKMPVEVVSGEFDQATPPELGQEIAVSFGRGRHAIVNGAAHHVPTRTPDAIAALLRDE